MKTVPIVPAPPGVDTDFFLNTMFAPPSTPETAVETDKKEESSKATEISYDCRTQTLVLWRPPEVCVHCKDSSDAAPLGEGDLTVCPHVQTTQYQEVVNSVFTKKTILHFEEFFMLPNGTRCVQLVWLVVKKVDKPKEKPVYPPNPEKVFAQKDEEPKDKDV